MLVCGLFLQLMGLVPVASSGDDTESLANGLFLFDDCSQDQWGILIRPQKRGYIKVITSFYKVPASEYWGSILHDLWFYIQYGNHWNLRFFSINYIYLTSTLLVSDWTQWISALL